MEGILHQSWTPPIAGFIAFSLVFWLNYIVQQLKSSQKDN
jgi:hypothetical protein